MEWPRTAAELERVQGGLAQETPVAWAMAPDASVGAVFVCFGRGGQGPGERGDLGWAGAVVERRHRIVASCVEGEAGAPYRPGYLALREGPLLSAAVRGLRSLPAVLIVNATGRDHPRRAGLALHLGAILDLPTIGVTNRLLVARGEWPDDRPGAAAPLILGGENVGYWLRVRSGVKPIAIHAGWRTDPRTALDVVRSVRGPVRTPRPLRRARTIARLARSKGCDTIVGGSR